MNFKKLAAIMLVLVMCLTSIGALATTEEEYEARIAELEERIAELEHQLAAKDYVAEFDGGVITAEEAMEQFEYISYMYSSYGYSVQGYEDTIKGDILTSMVEDAIVKHMGRELGFYDLDEDTKAELMASAQEDLDGYIENYRSQFESDEVGEETIIQATTEYLAQNGITLDGLYEDNLEFHVSDQVFEHVAAGIEVTEEDVKAKYDELVGQDQIAYAAGSQAYEAALLSGTAIYWHPVGYRNVRQVLVKFDDDQSARYSELDGLITSLNDELTTALDTENAEEGARSAGEINEELKAAEADMEALYAELQPTVDEVYAKFEEGVSIDELISTYGGDPGSINEDGTTNTYAVSAGSTSYDPAFRDAAMSIENVGELAEPSKGMYGIYIIYYDSDVVSGAVAYETVKDDIYNTALDDARNTAYTEQVEAWKTELNVVTYPENFK